MKRGGNFFYFLGEGISNIWKNGLMSIASVGILGACLLIMGCVLAIIININSFIGTLEDENMIVAFIDESYSDAEVTELSYTIRALPNVSYVEHVTKQQAFEEYKAIYANDADLEGIDESVMRDSFRIYLQDLSLYDASLAEVTELSGVANVRDDREVVEQIVVIRQILSVLNVWIVLILAGVSVFIVSNTVKLTMYTRSLEISIMKNVGATDWFIRWPYIIEGFILGLISAAAAFGLVAYFYNSVLTELVSNIGFITPVQFSVFAPKMAASFALAGIMVGVAGSSIALKRYLYGKAER